MSRRANIDSFYFKKNEKIAFTLNTGSNKRIDLCLTVSEQKIHLNVSQRRRERETLFFSYVVSIPSTATDKTISPSFENTASLLLCSTSVKIGVEKSHLFFFSQQTGEDFSIAN